MPSRKFLNVCQHAFNLVVAVLLISAGLFAGYSLWDNQQVYATASDVRDSLLSLRPHEGEDNGPTFDELRAINPDVIAWITLDGTKIDYPIVQGEDDLEYLNKDVYGNFALSGAIFLSTQSSPDFSDAYSLVYGHHMDNSMMFGDLDLYLDQAFFDEHTTGVLMTPDTTYYLEIVGVLTVTSSDSMIFSTASSKHDCRDVTAYVASHATYLHDDEAEKIAASEAGEERVVALATCSSQGTEARTVILARMVPYGSEG